MLNVTVTNPNADGYLTVWPCGEPVPLSSNANYTRQGTVANDVVVDLQGTFGAGSPYEPITPRRLLDTRY